MSECVSERASEWVSERASEWVSENMYNVCYGDTSKVNVLCMRNSTHVSNQRVSSHSTPNYR